MGAVFKDAMVGSGFCGWLSWGVEDTMIAHYTPAGFDGGLVSDRSPMIACK
jgi:hypothetical protein